MTAVQRARDYFAMRGALKALRMAEQGLRDAGMVDAADEVYALACGIGGGSIALR